MKESTLNILCATDDNYVPYCGIMLESLFANNKNAEAYIIIDRKLSIESNKKFEELSLKYNSKIYYVIVNPELLSEFPLHKEQHFTIAAYYRLLAANILPRTLDRILYLDCDIIVNSSLNELWNIDLNGKSAAVVSDICSGFMSNFERLDYPKEMKYFNSGVMLINLKYWRETNIFEKFYNFAVKNKERILWPDQDVLNAVLVDSKIHIPIKYNYQLGFLSRSYYDTLPQSLKDEVMAEKNPIIIHYNQTKPWGISYYNFPYNQLWHKYKKQSPWRHIFDVYPPKKKLNYFIKRWIVWPLGFMTDTNTIKV